MREMRGFERFSPTRDEKTRLSPPPSSERCAPDSRDAASRLVATRPAARSGSCYSVLRKGSLSLSLYPRISLSLSLSLAATCGGEVSRARAPRAATRERGLESEETRVRARESCSRESGPLPFSAGESDHSIYREFQKVFENGRDWSLWLWDDGECSGEPRDPVASRWKDRDRTRIGCLKLSGVARREGNAGRVETAAASRVRVARRLRRPTHIDSRNFSCRISKTEWVARRVSRETLGRSRERSNEF